MKHIGLILVMLGGASFIQAAGAEFGLLGDYDERVELRKKYSTFLGGWERETGDVDGCPIPGGMNCQPSFDYFPEISFFSKTDFPMLLFYTRARLGGARLMGAKLNNANMSHADLRFAKLKGAELCGTDLTGAKNLTLAQIRQACICEDTILPENLEAHRDSIPTCR